MVSIRGAVLSTIWSGARCVVNYVNDPQGRNAADATRVAAEIGAALTVECDVSDAVRVGRMIEQIERSLGGGLDVLVNNAGVLRDKTIRKMTPDEWQTVIGVNLTRYKVIAFAISSFYAGVAGALLYVIPQTFTAGNFSLLMSVQFIAMILIGGIATISGSIMGALFITLLPRITSELPAVLPFINTNATGGGITVVQVEAILYGLLIIGFLLFESKGLFGIWIRVRNYWKAWPFSY